MEADFSGYATKNGLKCSDGRTIMAGAFKHNDKQKVPLVWQHQHNDPNNILGHALLENRDDGVYTFGFFNSTPAGKNAKTLVKHGDIEALSIFANNLTQQGANVTHGDIKEVSLVLSGANPGAFIDNINLLHGDGHETELDDEAVIYTGLTLEHENIEEQGEIVVTQTTDTVEHADEKTVKDVFDSLTEEQKNVVYFMIGEALESAGAESVAQDDVNNGEFLAHIGTTIGSSIKEGFNEMSRNVFEQNGHTPSQENPTLTHAQMHTIVSDAQRLGSLKESFLEHAAEYGIDDIDFLFPDAKTLTNTPDFIARRMEWVTHVLNGVRKSPFSRVKSVAADITADEARAKGYVKGNLKKDEVIKLLKRVTGPKTIYKKQKLDRDDIVDITGLDVVAWLKAEMRVLLDEEIAGAILVGDGRESDDEDKIDEDHIRPIAFDVDMYNTTVALDGTPTSAETVEAIIRASENLKGSGTPNYYTTQSKLTDLLLDKDTLGRRYYNNKTELADAIGVGQIVVVEAMLRAPDVVGILVNLADYTVGADQGGEINMFDDFDIDYNQQKYLIETRISGALTKPKAAVTITGSAGTVVTPQAPTFVTGTGVVTIPSQTGVVYKNDETGATLTAGAQAAIPSGDSLEVQASPAGGYSFPHGGDYDWVFTRP